jgi:hypothetical protein
MGSGSWAFIRFHFIFRGHDIMATLCLEPRKMAANVVQKNKLGSGYGA